MEIAVELVRAGVPFREAHQRLARFLAELDQEAAPLASASSERIARAFPELAGRGFTIPTESEEPDRRTSAGGSSTQSALRLLAAVGTRRRGAAAELARARRRLSLVRRELGVPESLFAPGALR